MRELKVVGLDVDGKRIICETADAREKFLLRPDARLLAALRGDRSGADDRGHSDREQPSAQSGDEVEEPIVLSPREIQARIRAGASVEQVAADAGVDPARVERFAHPVLLERSRAAELATASHPVLADGPAVLTLLETISSAMVGRGLDPDAAEWDAWRNEDGRWTVRLAWRAGRSDNAAHFRFTPGAHGGTAVALDDAAIELIDPEFRRPPLRAVSRPAPVFEPMLPLGTAGLDDETVGDPTLDHAVDQSPAHPAAPNHPAAPAHPAAAAEPADAGADGPAKPRSRRRKPEVPAWEDVLLGVRSGTRP